MAKGKEYVIKKGDTLISIAKKNDYKDWKVIWNDPENKDLVRKRGKPESIVAGDTLFLPEQEDDKDKKGGKDGDKDDKNKKGGKDGDDGKDDKPDPKEFLNRLMTGRLTPEDKKMLMPDLYDDLTKATPSGKEQQDILKALKGMGPNAVKGSKGLDDIAEKVKKHVEVTKGDWVIKPDLGTIFGGLKDLAKKVVK